MLKDLYFIDNRQTINKCKGRPNTLLHYGITLQQALYIN